MKISVTVHMPKKEFKASNYIDACAEVMKSKTQPELTAMFRQTVYGWSAKNKPGFNHQLQRWTYKVSMRVFAGSNDDVYYMVNKGAGPHPIDAVNAPMLHFKKGYRAATQPGHLQSQRAFRSLPWVTKKHVDHPGFDARDFDVLIGEEYRSTFEADMKAAMASAAKEQGS